MHLKEFFKKYIANTPEKAVIVERKMFLGYLTKAVMEGLEIENSTKNVFITSRCLKHLFDKKPAEEFLFLLDHLHEIVKFPDRIYKNLAGKRGDFCFVKKIKNEEYFCTLELLESCGSGCENVDLQPAQMSIGQKIEIQIATAFRLRDKKYTKNYTLLWDWGNGNPHRSVLDTHKESTNAPQ